MRAFLVSSLATTLLFCSTASADLTGSWSYRTSGSWKKGVCPIGKDGPGKIKVTKKGKAYKLVFVSGRVCRPASMCTFEGRASGNKYTFSNAAKVDNEGGKVVNKIALTASAKQAEGSGTSSYKHPSGMTCKWGSKITMSRQ